MDTGANSFYKMTIVTVEKRTKTKYIMLWEYGRTGTSKRGHTYREATEPEAIIEEWGKKFAEMTGNDWADRTNFEKKPGKYFMTKLDDGNDESEENEAVQAKKEELAALEQETGAPEGIRLDERVCAFVEMVFDKDMMNSSMESMGVDVKKMPLGKIKTEQIKEGYLILSALSDVLKSDDAQRLKKVKDLSARFYTLIPHTFLGDIPLIDTLEMVAEKVKLVDTMCDIEIAMKLLEQERKAKDQSKMQVLYEHYQKLHTVLTPLDKQSERYKLLETYVKQSQEKGSRIKLLDVLEVEREGETERFVPHSDDANRQLLWHGSRLTNYVGILSTGLRIAPPEAPASGYRFGKGIYFADCMSKSSMYTTVNKRHHGVMLLCEVALGKPWKTERDKYMEKPQPGSDSTFAMGMVCPNPDETVTLDDGLQVPLGHIVPSGLEQSWCTHDEFIVYDVARVRIRYVLMIQK